MTVIVNLLTKQSDEEKQSLHSWSVRTLGAVTSCTKLGRRTPGFCQRRIIELLISYKCQYFKSCVCFKATCNESADKGCDALLQTQEKNGVRHKVASRRQYTHRSQAGTKATVMSFCMCSLLWIDIILYHPVTTKQNIWEIIYNMIRENHTAPFILGMWMR